ncbi:MAG: hypothetical protein KGZ93_09575 [Actinobacteria bacterium]|nr:hypothetical protein [Actinomycetota bacterium]
MDGFIVTAVLFGIISLLALYVIFRAIKNYIREGKEEQAERSPAAPRAIMTAMPKPAQAAAKPGAAPAQAPRPAVVAEPKEAEKAKEPEVTIEAEAAQETQATQETQAAEPVKAEDKGVEAEGEYPPIKTQAPNGESEKRVAEIQDILGKHL